MNTNKLEKHVHEYLHVHEYIKVITLFIICSVLFITFPFVVAFVHAISSVLGTPAAYIATGITSDFYGPLLVVLALTFLWLMYKVIRFNLFINGVNKLPGNRLFIKAIFALLVGMITIGLFAYNNIVNMTELILDIQNLSTSHYAQMDGTLYLYEVSHGDVYENRIQMNGVKFVGGFVAGEKIIEGTKYHLEYLPHSKYVVKYYRIKQ